MPITSESAFMFELSINSDWQKQIADIRNATTDDTNLIRFDNSFYRVCRAAVAEITVTLKTTTNSAMSGRPPVELPMVIGTRDFYVSHIGGQPFDRYASTIDQLRPSAGSLENALYEVRTATGDRLFQLRTLLVFCVAESIRSDMIATRVGQMIAASTDNLRGVSRQLNVSDYLPQIRNWGRASDAVWAALSPEARQIATKLRSTLKPAERQFSERVNENAISGEFRAFARSVKVLKRPASF
jgi:hypothetical protein